MTRYVTTRALAVLALTVAAACYHAGRAAAPGAAPSAKPADSKALPDGVTQDLIETGDSIFHAPTAACNKCHGPQGDGGKNAPSLMSGPWLQVSGTFTEINAVIVNGVPKEKIKDPSHQFGMNPRGGPMRLTDDQARALAAYVWSISRKKTKA